jgi:hypothetical protein
MKTSTNIASPGEKIDWQKHQLAKTSSGEKIDWQKHQLAKTMTNC